MANPQIRACLATLRLSDRAFREVLKEAFRRHSPRQVQVPDIRHQYDRV